MDEKEVWKDIKMTEGFYIVISVTDLHRPNTGKDLRFSQ
jgi:hypothetical protein